MVHKYIQHVKSKTKYIDKSSPNLSTTILQIMNQLQINGTAIYNISHILITKIWKTPVTLGHQAQNMAIDRNEDIIQKQRSFLINNEPQKKSLNLKNRNLHLLDIYELRILVFHLAKKLSPEYR